MSEAKYSIRHPSSHLPASPLPLTWWWWLSEHLVRKLSMGKKCPEGTVTCCSSDIPVPLPPPPITDCGWALLLIGTSAASIYSHYIIGRLACGHSPFVHILQLSQSPAADQTHTQLVYISSHTKMCIYKGTMATSVLWWQHRCQTW